MESFKPKTGIISFVIVLILFLLAVLVYRLSLAETEYETLQSLEFQVESRARVLSERLDELVKDIIFLQRVPPVQGIIRAQQNDGVDPYDGSSLATWKSRLESIFTSYLESNENVYQVRFVGVGDEGKELVRVQKTLSDIEVVPENKLQAKAHRDYFAEILSGSLNGAYISQISLNRENGQIEYPIRPTIRIALSVTDAASEVFGFVIINVSVEKLFAKLLEDLPDGLTLYIVNEHEDFIVHPDASKTFRFEYGTPYKWQDQFSLGGDNGRHDLQYSAEDDEYFQSAVRDLPLIEGLHKLKFYATFPYRQIQLAAIKSSANSVLALLIAIIIVAVYFILIRRSLQQKELLSLANARKNAIVNCSKDAIVGFELDGRITDWNKGAFELFGYTREEVVDRYSYQLLFENAQVTELEKQFKALEEGDVVKPLESVCCIKSGEQLIVSVSISPIINDANILIGVSTIIRDITQAKKNEARIKELNSSLEKKKEQLTKASEVAGLGIWSWEIENDKLNWNKKMFEIYGLKEEDLRLSMGMAHWQDFLVGDQRESVLKAFNNLLENDLPFESIFEIKTPAGDIKHIKAGAVVERDSNGKASLVLGINFDITHQVNYQRALKQAKLQADEASRVKSEFVANMSHEVRTPMTSILGLLELLKKTELTPKQLDYLNKSEQTAKSLLRILNDILDFSKVESGKMELDAHPFRIREILDSIKFVLKASLGEKQLELMLNIDDQLPEIIVLDSMRLQQILMNLAGNAIKFTQEGFVSINLTREMLGDKPHLKCTVKDSGVGIDEDFQKKLFQGFSQAQSSTARQYGGTGLGLSISKHLVELMGGTISVESEPGIGSTFTVRVPYTESGRQNLPSRSFTSSKSETIEKPLSNLRILLVEDNPINRLVAKEMLELEGGIVTEAFDGQNALNILQLQGDQFDVVLMDIQMPLLDGYEATRRIKQEARFANLPIIAMTANVMREDKIAARQAGMIAHVGKPIDMNELIETVLQCTSKTAPDTRQKHNQSANNKQAISTISVPEYDNTALLSYGLIDAEAALKRLRYNKQIYAKTLELFLKDAPDMLQSIPNQWPEDSKAVFFIVHTLKGLAGTVGADRFAAVCEKIVKALNANREYDKYEDDVGVLKGMFRDISPQLRDIQQTNGVESREAEKDESFDLCTQLRLLKDLLAVSNMQACDLFENIRKQSDHATGENFERLANYMRALDFAAAEHECRLILEAYSEPLQ